MYGSAAVVGIGESDTYQHGKSPISEWQLCLQAVFRAIEDAGLSPRDVDGLVSYGDQRGAPSRVASMLGVDELAYSTMVWGGGGGGAAAGIVNAAAAIATGQATCVVVYRALAQGQFQRYGQGARSPFTDGPAKFRVPYGQLSPVHDCALVANRFMIEHDIAPDALKSVALAASAHAQFNPRAHRYGRPLSADQYESSRWISTPFRLFDCCLESDAAGALVLVSADRAQALKNDPAFLLGAAVGTGRRRRSAPFVSEMVTIADMGGLAERLWQTTGASPADVDVVQVYDNFTSSVVLSLIGYGFCSPERAEQFFTVDNLTAPNGGLPVNTSGGQLADCFTHGMSLVIEAVRQIRGTSTAQVPNVSRSLFIGAPVFYSGSVLFGSEV